MTVFEASFRLRVGRGDDRFELGVELSLAGGVLVLFGPSGSGKSLTLKSVVGVARPDTGYIRLGDETLFDDDVWVPPHRRQIGYVPQHHSLFPFCSVRDNIAFGLPRAERRNSAVVRDLIEELELNHLADAMPARLSGGERQRVALARALAVRPRLLVLDEPFASIDVVGRRKLRQLVRETLARHAIPALFVTHSPAEAKQIGDHVTRFERGRSCETGTPEEVVGDLCEQ